MSMDDYDYSNTNDSDLRKQIAILTLIQERAKNAIDSAKSEAMRRGIGEKEAEETTLNGAVLGTINRTKDGEGSYMVTDPLAYAQALAHSDYANMVEEVLYPKPEAMTKSFVKARAMEELYDIQTGVLVKNAGIPVDGTTLKPGKAGSIQFRRNKSVTEHIFEQLAPSDVALLIAGKPTVKEEN